MTHKGTVALETERLILRRFTPKDAEAMFRNWVNDPDVTRFLTWQPHGSIDVTRKISLSDISKYEDSAHYQWAVVLKSLNEPIGGINIVKIDERCNCFEIAYRIGKAWWHKGFASEALSSVIKFLFEQVGVNRITAVYDTRNPNSGAVMRKCGMSYEGTLRQSGYNNQGIFDAACYAILAEDYFVSAKNEPGIISSNVSTVKTLTELMFHNLKIAMDTSDWNADISGAPAWRYIYHTIHSADRFFINPSTWQNEDEPAFHSPKLDWPDTATEIILSPDILYGYHEQVRKKILDYLGSLNDIQLSEIPDGCASTRLGLIMEQFRHMYAHIGILNGITIANTGLYPRVINLSTWRAGNISDELYDTEQR